MHFLSFSFLLHNILLLRLTTHTHTHTHTHNSPSSHYDPLASLMGATPAAAGMVAQEAPKSPRGKEREKKTNNKKKGG